MIKKLTKTLLVIIAAAVVFTGCGSISNETKTKFSDQYYDVFDTAVSVTVYCSDRKIFDSVNGTIHEMLQIYHQLFDIYNEYDGVVNIKTLNDKAAQGPVEVSADITEFLSFAADMCRKTDGCMNIAMGAVLSLWHEAREKSLDDPSSAYIPSEAELKEAAQHCSIDDLVIDTQKNTVFFADPLLKIDAGAVAKGWAVEKTAQLLESRWDELKQHGVRGIIISAGGNVRIAGNKPGGTWTVAIQDPDSPDGSAYIAVIEDASGSIVTSGAYQRYFEYNGKKYHHIIDKDSLMPEDRFLSVSIQTADSGYADALSAAALYILQSWDHHADLLHPGVAHISALPLFPV